MTPNQSPLNKILTKLYLGHGDLPEGVGIMTPSLDLVEAEKAIKSLFLEILVAQKAHVLSSYKDEVDDEAKEQNALYDYALFQLDSIGKKWEQL